MTRIRKSHSSAVIVALLMENCLYTKSYRRQSRQRSEVTMNLCWCDVPFSVAPVKFVGNGREPVEIPAYHFSVCVFEHERNKVGFR